MISALRDWLFETLYFVSKDVSIQATKDVVHVEDTEWEAKMQYGFTHSK